MIPKPETCRGCVGYDWSSRLGFVPAHGDGTAGVLLVFEAAGADEEAEGRPMVGAAGFTLNRLIRRAGLTRDMFRIHNVLSCRPPGNRLAGEPYERAAIARCRQYLDRTIREMKPRCIVAGGRTAFLRLLGEEPSLQSLWATPRKDKTGEAAPDEDPRNAASKILLVRGYTFWSHQYSCWIVPTVHPSFIMRGRTEYGAALIRDLQHAVTVATNGYAHATPHYTLDPAIGDLEAWEADFTQTCAAHPETMLAFDIETPYKSSGEGDEGSLAPASPSGQWEDETYELLRISFAFRPYQALSVPFTAHYLPTITRLLGSAADKVVWNQGYDVPRLLANGYAIGGVIHDGMVAWHVLHSDMPKGLAHVATFCCPDQPMWKHMQHAQPAYYSAVDSDVALRNYLKTKEWLHEANLWDVFETDVLQLEPVLQHMTNAGMPVDAEIRERLALELAGLKDVLEARMNACIPETSRRYTPANGYVREPASTEGLVRITVQDFVKRCSNCEAENPTKAHFKAFKRKENPCADAAPYTQMESIERWARPLPFKPSRTQILAYQKERRHPPVTQHGKPTTNERAIRALIGRFPEDPLYPFILQYRQVDKIAGTYIGRPA